MEEIIKKTLDEIEHYTISNTDELNAFKIKYNKILTDLFKDLKIFDNNKKKEIGPLLNNLKSKIDEKYKFAKATLIDNKTPNNKNIDHSLQISIDIGNTHPLTNLENKLINIFKNIGFDYIETQEIEDDWHNFTALNFPQHHPARDMQDTFFIKNNKGDKDILLRTHTTTSQIRILEKYKPPIKCITIGRTYRNETISARSHCYFNQIDGFFVDTNVSMNTLINILKKVYYELFKKNLKLRFRPSYFPFTSPSIEIDIECFICNNKGCSICKQSGWLEVIGGGIIHENVLKNCNIDTNKYTGIAFGGGIERLSLLIHKINDIRLFSTNDIRFLSFF